MMRKIKDLLLQLCLSTNEKIMACSPREHYFTIIGASPKMKKKNSINKDGNPPWNLTLLALWQKLVWLVNMLRVRVGIYRGKGDKTVLKQSKRRDCSNCQAPTSTNIKKKENEKCLKKAAFWEQYHQLRGIGFFKGKRELLICTFICSSFVLSDMYNV